jgi:tryptophan halogenase
MNIVIVGGGTAGWIASFFISKSQPQHSITVIESSKIGIIGAGEGSTGLLRDILSGYFFDYKHDIEDFMQKTNSTKKLGIRHKNWSGDGSSYFAPLDVSSTAFQTTDSIFKYSLFSNTREKMHMCTHLGYEYENNNYSGYTAFHFDAFKVGEFFKDICIKDHNVKSIDSIVTDVNIKNGEIESIILENGEIISGDFFIDCSGFKRVLANKMDIKWNSFSDYLPVNTAMPFILEYSDNEKILPETGATAMSSGWVWDIPLKNRRGCGYVFDKNFIDEKKAQKEVESKLGHSIEPIKFIEFDSGYVEKFWKNNLLVLGLASSFVEPLEATSIHNTIVQIVIFVNEFLLTDKENTVNQINQDIYNKKISLLNDITIDFISLHYQGGRHDSSFWKNIKDKQIVTPNAKMIIEKSKQKIPGFIVMEGMWGSASIPLFNWILAGMNIITPEQALRDLIDDNKFDESRSKYNSFISQYKNIKKPYIIRTDYQ